MTGSPFDQGKALAKESRFEEALPLLEVAARERSDSPDVWLALAACYFRVERHDEFREAIRKALSLDPDHTPTKRFLRQITGTDVIPAADTGRPKIVMEEEAKAFPHIESDKTEELRGGIGCFGILLALGILMIALAF